MGLRTSDVVPNSEARAPLTELEEEHVELILLNDAEIGLNQVPVSGYLPELCRKHWLKSDLAGICRMRYKPRSIFCEGSLN